MNTLLLSQGVPMIPAAGKAVGAQTGNPALVLAAGVMGTLFGVQRRATGGVLAPLLTHLIWASLMLHFLPPLFAPPPQIDTPAEDHQR